MHDVRHYAAATAVEHLSDVAEQRRERVLRGGGRPAVVVHVPVAVVLVVPSAAPSITAEKAVGRDELRAQGHRHAGVISPEHARQREGRHGR